MNPVNFLYFNAFWSVFDHTALNRQNPQRFSHASETEFGKLFLLQVIFF